jgi:hypothetical protein
VQQRPLNNVVVTKLLLSIGNLLCSSER